MPGKKNKGKSNKGATELIFKGEFQEYVRVLKLLGDGRLEGQMFSEDGKKLLCIIRGTMRKRVWIKKDDVILVSLRDFEKDKADVILKYNDEDVRKLIAYKELPPGLRLGIQDNEEEVDFDEETIDTI